MTPERWQRVKEIFHSALQLAPGERSAFLAEQCGKDEGLRREVESLLASHEKPGRGSYAVSTLGAAYAVSGKRREALGILTELEQKYAMRGANGTDVAIVQSALGNNDQAMAWLEKDLTAGNTAFLVVVTNTYVHDRLYDDPRYKDFLRRMGLKVR